MIKALKDIWFYLYLRWETLQMILIFHFEREKKGDCFLHAVQGKPPSSVTGRVGAVGQIHLICVT